MKRSIKYLPSADRLALWVPPAFPKSVRRPFFTFKANRLVCNGDISVLPMMISFLPALNPTMFCTSHSPWVNGLVCNDSRNVVSPSLPVFVSGSTSFSVSIR